MNPETDGARFALNVRVPGWCTGRPVPSDLYVQTEPGSLADFSVKVNGEAFPFAPEKGYCSISRSWKKGDAVEVSMNMPVKRIKAHDAVKQDRGRLAVERGPILYCAEGVDNDGRVLDAIVAADAAFSLTTCEILGNAYPALSVPATSVRRGLHSTSTEKTTLKLVPYFAWCHRGAGEMQTWFPTALEYATASRALTVKASHCNYSDNKRAAIDGILPKSSDDKTIPRLTFWDHLGTREWVEFVFTEVEEVKGVEVYWFDDEPSGRCRLPDSWRVQWRADEKAPWQAVAVDGPVAKDKFCTIDFPESVKAKAVRIDISLQKDFSGGILECRFK